MPLLHKIKLALISGTNMDSSSVPSSGQYLCDKSILSCRGYVQRPQVMQVYRRLNLSVIVRKPHMMQVY